MKATLQQRSLGTVMLLILAFPGTRSQAEDEGTECRFVIRSRIASVKLIGPEGGPIEQIRITVEHSSIKPQVIDCQAEDIDLLPAFRPVRFEIADYDGDGFNDFSVKDTGSSGPSVARYFFFWSPRHQKFYQRRDVRDSDVAEFQHGIFRAYSRAGS